MALVIPPEVMPVWAVGVGGLFLLACAGAIVAHDHANVPRVVAWSIAAMGFLVLACYIAVAVPMAV